VLARVALGYADTINIGTVDGVAVITVESVEGIHSPDLECPGLSTHSRVLMVRCWEPNGGASLLGSFLAKAFSLDPNLAQTLRAFLILISHVQVDQDLLNTRWSHVMHGTVLLDWIVLPYPVVSSWHVRLGVVQVSTGGGRILGAESHVDELLELKSNSKHRLRNKVQVILQ